MAVPISSCSTRLFSRCWHRLQHGMYREGHQHHQRHVHPLSVYAEEQAAYHHYIPDGLCECTAGSWQTLAAGIIVVMIPTVLTYIFFQKYILAGIAAGAVKE